MIINCLLFKRTLECKATLSIGSHIGVGIPPHTYTLRKGGGNHISGNTPRMFSLARTLPVVHIYVWSMRMSKECLLFKRTLGRNATLSIGSHIEVGTPSFPPTSHIHTQKWGWKSHFRKIHPDFFSLAARVVQLVAHSLPCSWGGCSREH